MIILITLGNARISLNRRMSYLKDAEPMSHRPENRIVIRWFEHGLLGLVNSNKLDWL